MLSTILALAVVAADRDEVRRHADANVAAWEADSASADIPGTTLLRCEISDTDAAWDNKRFFGDRTVTEDAAAQELVANNLQVLIVSPPNEWRIDWKAKTMKAERAGTELSLELEAIGSRLLLARSKGTGPLQQVLLDRMTGHGTLLFSVELNGWNERHGTHVSPYREWPIDCRPLQKTF